MARPTIAAIVPVYNRPGVVLEALDSIAWQSVPPTKLIVVDDGSTDDTAERVARWLGARQWIGSIIHPDGDPQYEKRQGYESGIHQVANALIKERQHYLAFCRLALALRGVWWWVPVFVPFYIFGCFGDWRIGAIKLAAGVVALGVGFPLSVEASRRWNLRQAEYSGNVAWAEAEVFYGALHGVVLVLLLVL